MKERPILFSGPMVRAILDGRKTMTRRVVKPQSLIISGHPPRSIRPCKYGVPGDRLWVRETFCQLVNTETKETNIYYASTDDIRHFDIVDGDGFTDSRKDGMPKSPWKPSIHMPRWVSRITLEITGLRVERLNEISEEDAVREGIENIAPNEWRDYRDGGSIICPCGSFLSLWEKINGRESWDNNPWVWVIEFRKITEELK